MAATVHYNTFSSSDGRDSGTINDRTLTFTKQSDDSVILVTWYDNFRTNGSAKACRWEIYLNGQQCSSPARINGDFYVSSQNMHRFGVITGLCDTAGSDPLNTGSVAITAQVGNSPGYSGSDCYTGWNGQQSILMAQELVF